MKFLDRLRQLEEATEGYSVKLNIGELHKVLTMIDYFEVMQMKLASMATIDDTIFAKRVLLLVMETKKIISELNEGN